MKWQKVEDYPVGSDEYVLVSQLLLGQRENVSCFVAMLRNGYWRDEFDVVSPMQPTDRWSYITLPED